MPYVTDRRLTLSSADVSALREHLQVSACYLRRLADSDALHSTMSQALGDTLRGYAESADTLRLKLEDK